MKYFNTILYFLLPSIFFNIGNTYSTHNKNLKKINNEINNKKAVYRVEFELVEMKEPPIPINRITNNMMIDYCHIKENLPKYLVQFTREINGKTCKIPILFGRTPINCNDKKDQYWFFGVKPFEADNTVYILLKDKK